MASQRKIIRNHIETLLVGNTAAGNNVFVSRVKPLEGTVSIEVHTPRDNRIANLSDAPPQYRHRLDIQVNIIVEGNDGKGVADALDDIAHAVESLILVDDGLGDRCETIAVSSTEFSFDGEGRAIQGEAAIIFQAVYYQAYATIPQDDFGLIHADWDLHESLDSTTEAQDDVAIPIT